MEKKKAKQLFWVSAMCLGISSLSVMLTPFADFDGSSTQAALGYTSGIMFWLGLIAGLGVWIWLNQKLKKEGAFKAMKAGRPAIVSFFTNEKAKIVDGVLIVSLVLNVIAVFTPLGKGITGAILVLVFILAFHLHYMVNGKAYKYIFKDKK